MGAVSSSGSKRARDATKLVKEQQKVARYTAELSLATTALKEAVELSTAREAAAAKKEAAAAERAEQSRCLSDAGAITLVTTRIGFQAGTTRYRTMLGSSSFRLNASVTAR